MLLLRPSSWGLMRSIFARLLRVIRHPIRLSLSCSPRSPGGLMKPPQEDTTTAYVAIGSLCWEEASLLAAVNTVGLEELQKAIQAANTPRQLLRQVGGLKRPEVAERVRHEALRRVMTEKPGLPYLEVRKAGGRIVASFPLPPVKT